MSRFAAQVREIIAAEGPIPVERYMDLCLRHYYATRDPLGVDGDFTTAPEISQMFGELLGLWAAEVWRLAGAPDEDARQLLLARATGNFKRGNER